MRRQILNLIKSIFLIGFIIVAGLYVLNFTVTGDTAFVTKKTNLYSMTDEKEILKALSPGTSVSLLTYSNNDKIVKVRYEDSDNKKVIGFIDTDSCYSYNFPAYQTYSGIPIILSVSRTVSFKSFLNEFVSISEEYSVIGVYLEVSELSDKVSRIESFCEEQGVPYGEVWELTESNYEAYLHDVAAEELNEKNDLYNFKILPMVFNAYGVDVTSYPDLKQCIFYTDSDIGLDNHLSWVSVKSKTRDANLFNNGDIVASKFESNTKFGYSFVSDEFEKEIDDAYDTVNATRN